jgi:uncharacterized membrane protein
VGERLASAFSPFDVLVITLAGALTIAGVWWGIDGVPRRSPSAATLVAFVAASYVAGHLIGAVSGIVWRRERDPAKHPWTRAFAKALGDEGVDPQDATDQRLRRAFSDLRGMPVLDQVELIRSVLRQRKLDVRFETLNTVAWLSRSLGTATGLLAVFFLVLGLARGGVTRLLLAAAAMAISAAAFDARTRSYQWSSARVLKFEALALADPPAAFRAVSGPPTSEPDSQQAAGPSDRAADTGDAVRSSAKHV